MRAEVQHSAKNHMHQAIKILFYLLSWLSIMAFGFMAAIATKGKMLPIF